MFCATVLADIRLKCWKIMPTRRRRPTSCWLSKAPMSSPSISTLPDVGFSRRLRVRISEDLPAPLRPMMPNTSPRWTFSSISARACTELAPLA
ncbi:hypothetical protein D3C78_1320260 [compost metagenome]